jgi:hypothetical protein
MMSIPVAYLSDYSAALLTPAIVLTLYALLPLCRECANLYCDSGL